MADQLTPKYSGRHRRCEPVSYFWRWVGLVIVCVVLVLLVLAVQWYSRMAAS